MNRRISKDETKELLDAIRRDEIQNATAYAETFAAAHGLNPHTVRSTISRLRHELGLLQRQPRTGGFHIVIGEADPMAKLLQSDDATDLAGLGATVLLRYDEDPAYRDAVDQRRADIADLYALMSKLRSGSALLDTERDQVLHAIRRTLEGR